MSILLQKTSAVCARKPLWLCTNGVQFGIGGHGATLFSGDPLDRRPAMSNKRRLLRNVDLFLFVNVAQKVNQATDKRDCSEAERDPS